MTIGRALRYRQLRGRIDDVFRLEPMAPIVIADAADAPRHPLRGQVWIAGPAKTVYWYNGLVWVPLQGPPFSYRANLRVEFREKSDGVEPLVSAGRPGSGSVVYLRYL